LKLFSIQYIHIFAGKRKKKEQPNIPTESKYSVLVVLVYKNEQCKMFQDKHEKNLFVTLNFVVIEYY
jgi:hypothetical protein